MAVCDAEIGGVPIPAGSLVLGLLGAANRDPAQFAEPDRLDLRRDEPRHLGFGSGIHYCLGASLARLEAQVVMGPSSVDFRHSTLPQSVQPGGRRAPSGGWRPSPWSRDSPAPRSGATALLPWKVSRRLEERGPSIPDRRLRPPRIPRGGGVPLSPS
ncbi:MAG TPA: cytochrome P450 [Methylomirabilota bacterium]|nr:cytochrome P450 [Methylomirabilota bacterium]